MTDIVEVSLLSGLDRSHTQCNASSIYLEQTFVCRGDVQLIFKIVSRNKKIYTKCKSEKNTRGTFSTPQLILKSSFLLKLLTTRKVSKLKI